MLTLSELEYAVLSAFAEKEAEHSSVLREQITCMRVLARENTGHGFYTDLIVVGARAVTAPSPLSAIGASVEGVEPDMGFLLWLNDGKVACLEGYTIDGDLTGLDLMKLRFSKVGPRLRQ